MLKLFIVSNIVNIINIVLTICVISCFFSHHTITNLFISAVFESLSAEKQVPGTLTDRIGNSCTYVPNIHTKTLNNWVMNFYSNNNYLGKVVKYINHCIYI